MDEISLYVSPTGDDTNEGTLEAPFKTLSAARDAVRSLNNINTLPVTVYLRGGEYPIEETFKLDASDSGTRAYPIEYKNYQNEKVRLTGAKKIDYSSFSILTDTEKTDKLADKSAVGHVMVADLNALGLTNYGKIDRRGYNISKGTMPQMELAVNGERAMLARWPNSGFTRYSSVVRAGARNSTDILSGCEFKYDYDRPSLWNKPSEIFVSGVLGANFSYDYYPVGTIDTVNKTVTLSEGAIVPYYSKHFFYYENIFEEIDSPNEYYIDRNEGKLYLYPPENFSSSSDISVSYLEEPMIDIRGTSYVTFSGINFDGGRSNAIVASGCERLQIKNCDIRNFAGKGISVSKGIRNLISNCRLYNIGNTAVTMGGGDYVNIQSAYNVIENNEISKCSYIDKAYTSAITLSYQSVGALVRHNKIYDTPHTAMIIYGPEHRIEYNEIYDAVKEFHDMDAIYMNVSEFPWERGVEFKYNYIHDLGRRVFPEEGQMNVAGIRSDNGGHGILAEGNVFANIGKTNSNALRGICALGTRNVVRNNIFVDVSETFNANTNYNPSAAYDMQNANVIDMQQKLNSRLPVYGKKYPELYNFFNEHPNSALYTNVFENNLIVNIKYPLSSANGTPQAEGFRGAAQLVRAQGNYRTNADPGFADYSSNNYKLNTDSIVYTQISGFKKVPFELIGRVLQ